MGFLDGVGDFIEDVTSVPGDLVEAAASLYDGPGGVVGIFVSGALLYVGGVGALVPAVTTGVRVTKGINSLIKTRPLSSEEATLADMVFGKSLRPSHQTV